MGVGAGDLEAEDRALAGTVAQHPQPVVALQPRYGAGVERVFVGGDRLAVLHHQPVERGAPADRLQDRRGASLEAVGRVGVGDGVHRHSADHLAAALVGGEPRQRLLTTDQRSDAGRPEQLVAGEDVEVASDRLHVDAAMHYRLAAVQQGQGADRLRRRDHRRRVEDRAGHVGHVA